MILLCPQEELPCKQLPAQRVWRLQVLQFVAPLAHSTREAVEPAPNRVGNT